MVQDMYELYGTSQRLYMCGNEKGDRFNSEAAVVKVDKFNYLGSTIHSDVRSTGEEKKSEREGLQDVSET